MLGSYTTADGLRRSARLNRPPPPPPPAVYPEPIRLKKTVREAALAHAQRIVDDCSPDVIVPSLSLIELGAIRIARHNALRDSSIAEELRAMADELCSDNPYLTETDDWEHSHPSHKELPFLTLAALLCEERVNAWRANIIGKHTAVSDLLHIARVLVGILSTDQYDV